MKFHLPSFLLGVVTGASGATLAPRLRPVMLEIATSCYRLYDTVMLKTARAREDTSDLLAEARARAKERMRARAAKRGRIVRGAVA
jgi:hypothetical protein